MVLPVFTPNMTSEIASKQLHTSENLKFVGPLRHQKSTPRFSEEPEPSPSNESKSIFEASNAMEVI